MLNALGGEFPLLDRLLQDIFTYALFWLPRVNLPLKTSFPIKLFRFLETNVCWNQSSYSGALARVGQSPILIEYGQPLFVWLSRD